MPVLQDGEIVLYGFVGDDFWGDGFTAQDVLDALMEVGRDTDVIVRINSAGGYVHEGVAIYNALAAHKGKVTVHVDAIAASSASIIAMAGEERIMRTGSLMMIHDPATITFGTAQDHEKQRSMLDKIADQMAGIYADRTGDQASAIRDDMKEELWMTGEEAVERGFATATDEAEVEAFAAFDYRLFAHAPKELRSLAARNSWSLKGAGKQAASSAAVDGQRKEKSMSEKKPADATAADTEKAIATATAEAAKAAQARIKAIMTSEEAKGRESLAEHFAYETDLTAEAAVAALAKAPKAEATPGTSETETDPTAYENGRVRAAGQAQPTATQPKPRATINRSEIYASRRKLAKEG